MSTSTNTNAGVQADAPAIRITDVTRRFLTPDGKFHTAMRDFSLTVERGEFVCVVGPTGCGKSTTLNLVTGLIKPSAGQVEVMGSPVDGIDRRVGFRIPERRPVSLAQRARQRDHGADLSRHAESGGQEKAREWIAPASAWGNLKISIRTSCRAACASASHWRRRSSTSRKSCCSTNPSARSTCRRAPVMQDELLGLWSGTRASVVFVTHDLEEAVAMADKVVVLTASPATVKKIHKIDLPRPRVMSEIRYEPQFIEIARHIWEDLREEVQIGQRSAMTETH